MRYAVHMLAVAAVMTTTAAAAQQVKRTFVSGKGTDSGTCLLATPCRSFQYALSQTLSGGEVLVLDTAGYGPAAILRSVTITVPAGIVAIATAGAQGQNAIYVGNAVPFRLDGLTLDGPLYIDSVPSDQPGTGTIVNCTIRSGGAKLANGGVYEIRNSSITDGLAITSVRSLGISTTIARTTVTGQSVFGGNTGGINYGEMRVFDSSFGTLIVSGVTGASATTRMVRTNLAQFTLQQKNVAYLTASSIDRLTIQDQAVVNSFGNNDIVTVTGSLQDIPLR